MIESIKSYIQTHQNLFPVIKNPGQLEVFQMSGTNIRKEFNKVIFLIFEKDISQPALCVMISRNNHCQEELVKEYENLKRLGQGVSEYLKKSIPLPLALEKIENYLVLFETAAPGVSLARLASSPRHFYDRKNWTVFLKWQKPGWLSFSKTPRS